MYNTSEFFKNEQKRLAKISIIIPIYNVEKYLKKCVDSVRKQTYSNLEIILVDDGSTDNSSQVCDELARADQRIRVIHKENTGLSAARNQGLDIATGEYIAFVDSDDYIHPRMYEILYCNLMKYQADLSICDYKNVPEDAANDKMEEAIRVENVTILNNIEAIEKMNSEMAKMVVSWNKLYKKNVFKTVRFPEGKIHEDQYVAHYILYNVHKVVYIENQLYYYRQRKDSIIGSPYHKKRLDEVYAQVDRIYYLEGKVSEELLKKIILRYFETVEKHMNLLDKGELYYLDKVQGEMKKIEKDFSKLFHGKRKIAIKLQANLPALFYLYKRIKQSRKLRKED